MPDAMPRTFTPAEMAALRYIQAHSKEVPELGARELADRAGCSAATVIRLARKLGYAGYAEYRFALGRKKDVATATFQGGKRNLRAEIDTVSRLNRPEDIERCADLLAERDKIVLVGGGLSHTALEYLHHYLFSASCPTTCMPNDELSLDVIRSSTPDTLVICASVSGRGSTLELAREAHGRGMFVIGITSSLTSELVTLCDIHLLATSAPRSGTRLASRLGIIAVTDEIARTYAHRHLHGPLVSEEVSA